MIFLITFVDNFLCILKTFQEHIFHLEQIFDCLHKANIIINFNKCEFFAKEVKFLGYVLNSDEFLKRISKVEAIRNFPVPKNIKQLRSLLELANVYQRFCYSYSN